MTTSYRRKLSANERVLLMTDCLCPPIVNQCVVEGTGELDPDRWKKAVAEASAANPGTRVTLKGALFLSSWVDSGNTPLVREVKNCTWDGYGPEGAPFLNTRLNPFTGPVCEVVLLPGDPTRVVFRSCHAALDGRGHVLWMKDIFRVLSGKPPLGSDGTLTDVDMARRFNKGFRDRYPDEHLPPTGRAQGTESGVVWKRVSLKGKYFKVVPKIAVLTAKEAWKHGDGIVRFGIPVDMRIHDRKVRSTANLVFGITIEVTKASTPDEIGKKILTMISNKDDLEIFRGEEIVRYLPLWFIKRHAEKIMAKRHKTGLYNITGYISDMGFFNLKAFSGGGFDAKGFFPIPSFVEMLPFFLDLASYGNEKEGYTQELVLTMPKKFASNGRFDAILNRLKEGLEEMR